MKKLILSLFIVALLPTAAFAYSDVDGDHKYADAIQFLTDLKVINGHSDGSYRPEGTLNRAELLKIVIESKFSKEIEGYPNNPCFTDVKVDHWFNTHVCFAKDMGIVNGYADGNFNPSQEIIFVEAAKIILEVYGYSYDVEAEPWYQDITSVNSARNFIPLDVTGFDQELNRGQIADYIARVIHHEKGTLDAYLGTNSDFRVTYESLEKGLNVEDFIASENYIASTYVPPASEETPTTEEEPTATELPAPPENFTTFTSDPFAFSTVYPSGWYYSGGPVGDGDTIHHYGFGTEIINEEYDENDQLISFDLIDVISLDIVENQGPTGDPAGENIDIDAEYAFAVTSADELFIYLTKNGRNYRLSGHIDYQEALITMASSIQ